MLFSAYYAMLLCQFFMGLPFFLDPSTLPRRMSLAQCTRLSVDKSKPQDLCFLQSWLGLCLGWYGHLIVLYKTKFNWITWSPPKYVLPIIFSWYLALRIFWSTKWQIKFLKRFKIELGHWVTTKIWHIVGIMVPNIHAKFHNQPFIMRRAIWRHVFRHTDSYTVTHN